MLKKISKNTKSSFITCALVIVIYAVIQIMNSAGSLSSLIKGMLVLLCVFKRTKYLQYVIAVFVLSIFMLLYVLLPSRPWQLFLIAIPALVIVFLSCNIRIRPDHLPWRRKQKR